MTALMQADTRWKVGFILLEAKRPISTNVRMIVAPDMDRMMAPLTLYSRDKKRRQERLFTEVLECFL